jgi:hypothetical protein
MGNISINETIEERLTRLEKEKALYKIAIRDFNILFDYELGSQRSIQKYATDSNFQSGVIEGMENIKKNWEEIIEKLNESILEK